MTPRKFHLYIADLNPNFGKEPGKVRPGLVVQTNLLSENQPSTLICPVTTKINHKATILRVHLKKGEAGLERDSDIIVDQIRSIDNKRLQKHMGEISNQNKQHLLNSLKILILG